MKILGLSAFLFVIVFAESCSDHSVEKKDSLELATITLGKSYEFENGGVRFSYPDNWGIVGQNDTIVVIKELCSDTIKFCSSLNVQLVNSLRDYQLDSLLVLSRETIFDQFGDGGFRIMKESFISVEGLNGVVVDYLTKIGSIQIGGTIAIFDCLRGKVVINFNSGNYRFPGHYMEGRRILSVILNSIRQR